jgi:hypothetical protein
VYTVDVSGATDAAGNMMTPVSWSFTTADAAPPTTLFFSTVGNGAMPGVGGTADDADIYSWDGSAFARVVDAAGTGSLGLPSSANVDGYVRVDANRFYLSFAADTTVPGLGTVQDEDVVFYNGAAWSVFFDGTALGLTASGHDLDALSIVDGVLFFSTVGNANPPGVGGSADDADIYSWNGSSFARVWDATANGLPSGADVDGFKRVEAGRFYMSFNSTSTTVPGLGGVTDTSVVLYDGGSWSVFFDGSANGLTAGTAQDLDAFDIA